MRHETTLSVSLVFICACAGNAPGTATGNGATAATRPTGLGRRTGYIRSLTLGATEANPGLQGSLRPTS